MINSRHWMINFSAVWIHGTDDAEMSNSHSDPWQVTTPPLHSLAISSANCLQHPLHLSSPKALARLHTRFGLDWHIWWRNAKHTFGDCFWFTSALFSGFSPQDVDVTWCLLFQNIYFCPFIYQVSLHHALSAAAATQTTSWRRRLPVH